MSEPPEDSGAEEPRPGEEGEGPDEPEPPLRGWIHPDDRVWRHPSELAADRVSEPVLLNAPHHHPFRTAVMVLVAVAAVVAAAVWVVILLSPASDHPTVTASSDTTAGPITTESGPANAFPAAADAAGRAMVELRALTPRGPESFVGVSVAEGGLVVTTADALRGAQDLQMVGAGGKVQPASVASVDASSDLALVNVPVDVPVAPFADDGGVGDGSAVFTLSFVPSASDSLALHSTPGSVTSVATAIGGGPAAGMPSLTSSTAPPSSVPGEPLVNSSGSVMGILYDPAPPSAPGAGSVQSDAAPATTYLPTELVLGVADDLRSKDRVVEGWLGVTGADASNGAGAEVGAVAPNSPAAGRLRPGEVITALDQLPVRTMAELRARLYVLPPGTSVMLSVQQGGQTRAVAVTLSSSS